MVANKTGKFGKGMRDIMLVLGAAAIVGTAACGKAPNAYNAPAAGNRQPEVYVITGMPISVASTCKYGPSCYLALVLYDQNHEKKALVTSVSDDQAGITLLDAIIQAEINDNDTEPIKVVLDNNYDVSQITIEGVNYQP